MDKICPIMTFENKTVPCMALCKWNIDGKCIMERISLSLLNITKNTDDRNK
jgi:hypothetical protein